MKKPKLLSQTAAWMCDHPDDVPCPKSPAAATAWRPKRGLTKEGAEERARYQVAMIETRLNRRDS